MKRVAILLLAASLSACTTATLNCPSDHTVTATVNGPDIAQIATQLAALIGPLMMAQRGGVGAKAGAVPAAPTNDGTLTVKTLDIFGTQSMSCGNATPTPAS
jgi:hypothetical protein